MGRKREHEAHNPAFAEDRDLNSAGHTHPHWYTFDAPEMAKGRCRCTSIEHRRGEPGCEASPGGDGVPLDK